ncbi:MerR family transcriptional regulator [Spirillospora sp. NPDC048911]|uniref:MerR family transcriptional regulator n=1 Tax=Spirillospora sp. NPDC048911 TaxID=3364527 RepID=UPI0037183397
MERYSISQVARCFGLPVSTLRYYDDFGLLSPAERRGNVRYYGTEELRRLALIQRLHHHGLVSLTDTATLINDAEARPPSGREVLNTSITAIMARIDQLQTAQRLLEHLLTCPTGDPVRECTHLQEELDQAVHTALTQPPRERAKELNRTLAPEASPRTFSGSPREIAANGVRVIQPSGVKAEGAKLRLEYFAAANRAEVRLRYGGTARPERRSQRRPGPTRSSKESCRTKVRLRSAGIEAQAYEMDEARGKEGLVDKPNVRWAVRQYAWLTSGFGCRE